jgi:hypothetical protein
MHGKSYLNPFHSEIAAWMNAQGYGKWFMDKTDIVYYKKGTFEVTAAEKLQLLLMDATVRFRRTRKRAARFFSGKKTEK